MFTNLGILLFFSGLLIFVLGTGGAVQFVSQNGNILIDLLELAAIAGIGTALIVATLTYSKNRAFDWRGPVFMGAGVFMLSQASVMGINEYFDKSEATIRTFLVNNIDTRKGRKGTSYYAMVRSWWDPSDYIPLGISKSLHDRIIPRETYLDVAVHQGAFNMPYFGSVTINTAKNPQESLLEFNEEL